MDHISQHAKLTQPDDGEIIPIVQGADGQQAVSGRALHEFLGIGRDYTNWFKDMAAYGFTAGQDFTPVSAKTSAAGGRPRQDHALTLDMAKELSMIQRTDRGKQARQYFIAVEKRAQASVGAPESMAGMIRTLAATLLSIVDNSEPSPTSQPARDTTPQGSLFEIEAPRRNTIDTPSGFFNCDYVDERDLSADDRELAVRSLALAASNEYARIHGRRPEAAERWFMGKKTRGNVYTDADRPMLDALWDRRYYSNGSVA